uniref:Globoside alpha-1,3-N-acetylgalactosaminyltransferase 1 (FORS blood group) n=1 Tax=Hucho hucho TaxID=62062 RepID=A0A4W5LI68_9TELE
SAGKKKLFFLFHFSFLSRSSFSYFLLSPSSFSVLLLFPSPSFSFFLSPPSPLSFSFLVHPSPTSFFLLSPTSFFLLLRSLFFFSFLLVLPFSSFSFILLLSRSSFIYFLLLLPSFFFLLLRSLFFFSFLLLPSRSSFLLLLLYPSPFSFVLLLPSFFFLLLPSFFFLLLHSLFFSFLLLPFSLFLLPSNFSYFLRPSSFSFSCSFFLYPSLSSFLPSFRRTDVLTVTPWLAPIVWEGTFDPQVIDEAFMSQNLTIATTVFAVGKYTRFLQDFLESAEKHFMVGLDVHYYVFTDRPGNMPDNVTLGVGRLLSIVRVPKFARWQEISLRRMELIQTAIKDHIHRGANYIFCLDVDMRFHSRVGPEALGRLVAAIHPWFYTYPRSQYPYERRTISTAYIPLDQGDFYYQANIFGGALEDVYRLTKTCREHLEVGTCTRRHTVSHSRTVLTHPTPPLLYPTPFLPLG